jgi:hypothetical protein
MQWSLKAGAAILLAPLIIGCGGGRAKTTSRFELEGQNGALISGTFVIDDTNRVSIALVDSTNFTFTADKVSYAFTNVGTGGQIKVRLFQNEKPQGNSSGVRLVKGRAETTGVGSTMSVTSE